MLATCMISFSNNFTWETIVCINLCCSLVERQLTTLSLSSWAKIWRTLERRNWFRSRQQLMMISMPWKQGMTITVMCLSSAHEHLRDDVDNDEDTLLVHSSVVGWAVTVPGMDLFNRFFFSLSSLILFCKSLM